MSASWYLKESIITIKKNRNYVKNDIYEVLNHKYHFYVVTHKLPQIYQKFSSFHHFLLQPSFPDATESHRRKGGLFSEGLQ